jgi:hypothetical protein
MLNSDDLRRFDEHGPILPGPENEGQTKCSLAFREVQKVMEEEQFPKEIKMRIGALLNCLPISWALSFRGRPEAEEVAELLDSILTRTRLVDLFRQTEKGGGVLPGVADALEAAHLAPTNSYLSVARQIQTGLRLTILSPALRRGRQGRPSSFRAALVADAVADEIRNLGSRRHWPVVSRLFGPFLTLLRPRINGDPSHLHNLVDNWKRVLAQKVKKGKSSESWKDAKVLLYQEAGLA